MRLGLVDEYRLFLTPTVSLGATWYATLHEKPALTLFETTPYQNGVVGLHYRAA